MGTEKNRTTLVTTTLPTTSEGGLAAPASLGEGHLLLITMRGNNVGALHEVDLAHHLVIIGREDAAHIQVLDAEVSRRHAALRWDDNRQVLILVDLKSSNGTFLNGTRVEGEAHTKIGDKIGLGKTTILRVSMSTEPEAIYAAQMYNAVLRDALTGAFNRRYLDERVKTELAFAQRHEDPLSLLLLDLDHFKRTNDEHGHLAGDAVLREFVKLVVAEVRTEDVVARFGGEEFAVLCRDTSPEQALVLAERLRESTARHTFSHDGVTIPTTVSIGVSSVAGRKELDTRTLIEEADQALYGAKDAGRNRVVATSAAGSETPTSEPR